MRARMWWLAAVLVATGAHAQGGAVTGVFPQRALEPGTQTLDLGFATNGDVKTIDLSIEGPSPDGGTFVQVPLVTVQRDSPGGIGTRRYIRVLK